MEFQLLLAFLVLAGVATSCCMLKMGKHPHSEADFQRCTFVIDSTLVVAIVALMGRILMNGCSAALMVWMLYGFLFARELFYQCFFRELISKFKRSIPSNLVYHTLVTVGSISLHAWLFTWLSWVRIEPLDFESLGKAWLQSAVGAAIYEVCVFDWAHKLLHSPRFYFLHKEHHVPRKDCTVFGAIFFDNPIDMILGLSHGTCCVLLFGRGNVHLFTLFLTYIAAANVHSCNPYSLVFFVPPLDYFLKPNIHHQLHHAVQRGYYGNLPLHHLLPARLREDSGADEQISCSRALTASLPTVLNTPLVFEF